MATFLSRRRREPELMDQPGLAVRDHHRALAALGRANVVSRTTATLWLALRAAARAAGSTVSKPLRVFDVASGGGHVVVGLARRAARESVAVDMTGFDLNPAAIAYARTLAEGAGVEGVQFAVADALHGLWPGGADVVLCTLFLHHLDDEDAVSLLGRMKDAARQTVLVSDLCRSRLGFVFAWAGCRLLSRSRVFHVDGTRSVRAAFTPDEARGLAARAGLEGARVTMHWPQRWLLRWDR